MIPMLNPAKLYRAVDAAKTKPFQIRKSWTLAIAAKNNRIVAIGRNTRRLPITTGRNPGGNKLFSFHAEYNVVKRLRGENLNDIDLYVVRLLKKGGFANAKPCKRCEQLINECGIRRVYYTTDGGGMSQ